jgi:hypothetical protein
VDLTHIKGQLAGMAASGALFCQNFRVFRDVFLRAGCVESNSRCTPNAFASAIAALGCNGNVLVQ